MDDGTVYALQTYYYSKEWNKTFNALRVIKNGVEEMSEIC
jgi:hypothetical protein